MAICSNGSCVLFRNFGAGGLKFSLNSEFCQFHHFLVGAFLRKSARLLQWLVFIFFIFFFVRLQSHSDWATFLTIETTKTTSIRGQVRSVEISAKGSPLSFFYFFTVAYKTGRD